jgi:hypothetical protein
MFYGKGFGVVALLVELVFTASFAFMAGDGLLHSGGNQDRLGESLVAALLAGATGYAIYRRWMGAKEDQRFTAWLIANAERIRNNEPVFFRSQRISPDTELVRHHLVISAIVMSFRMHTRWIIKGREPRFGHALRACLYTMLYGWWGFPFGIYWTIVALIKNIGGSTTVKVRDLLQPAPAKATAFSQRLQSDFAHRLRAGFFIDEKPVGILPG